MAAWAWQEQGELFFFFLFFLFQEKGELEKQRGRRREGVDRVALPVNGRNGDDELEIRDPSVAVSCKRCLC